MCGNGKKVRLVVLLLVYSAHAQDASTGPDAGAASTQAAPSTDYYYYQYSFDPYWSRLTYITLDFKKYILMVIPPVSLVSNLCSLLVFLQPRRRRQNISVVMSALAVADIFALTLEWSSLIRYHTAFGLHDKYVFCDLIVYLTYVCRPCSSWYVFIFTLERFISVKFPLKKATIVTKPRLRITLAILTICCFISQMYFIFFVESLFGWTCKRAPQYSFFMYTTVKLVMREILGFILPSILTGALNMWIILILRSWSEKQAGLTGDNDASKEGNNKSLTVMLLTVSTFSIVVYSPNSIIQIYAGYTSTTPLLMVLINVIQPIGFLNHTCNFFFYCLGGKTFREDFMCLITCGRGNIIMMMLALFVLLITCGRGNTIMMMLVYSVSITCGRGNTTMMMLVYFVPYHMWQR